MTSLIDLIFDWKALVVFVLILGSVFGTYRLILLGYTHTNSNDNEPDYSLITVKHKSFRGISSPDRYRESLLGLPSLQDVVYFSQRVSEGLAGKENVYFSQYYGDEFYVFDPLPKDALIAELGELEKEIDFISNNADIPKEKIERKSELEIRIKHYVEGDVIAIESINFERFWRDSKMPVMRIDFALMSSKDASLYRIVPTLLQVDKVKNRLARWNGYIDLEISMILECYTVDESGKLSVAKLLDSSFIVESVKLNKTYMSDDLRGLGTSWFPRIPRNMLSVMSIGASDNSTTYKFGGTGSYGLLVSVKELAKKY